MQDDYDDINKSVIEGLSGILGNLEEPENLEPFEYYEKEFQKEIAVLRGAYKIKNYEHAQNVRKDMETLIKNAKKTAGTPDYEERLGKELKKYNILINLGKMFGGSEDKNVYTLDKLLKIVQIYGTVPDKTVLDNLFENTQQKLDNPEEKALELDLYEVLKDESGNIVKAIRDSVSQQIQEKTEPHFEVCYNSDDKKMLDDTIKHLEGTFTRQELFEKLKHLRKDYYGNGNFDEEKTKELKDEIEEAKKKYMEFEDIKNSFNIFVKDVLED